jgi:hypothetical protein
LEKFERRVYHAVPSPKRLENQGEFQGTPEDLRGLKWRHGIGAAHRPDDQLGMDRLVALERIEPS